MRIWQLRQNQRRYGFDLKEKGITRKTRYEFSLGKKDENCVGCNVITKQHVATGIM